MITKILKLVLVVAIIGVMAYLVIAGAPAAA